MKLLDRFNRGVSRFLYKHPNFGIPRLMLYLIIGNALVYLFSMMDRSGMLAWYLCLVPERLLKGELWRIITFIFVPRTSGLWLVIELYFYYMIGSTLERAWGAGKFTVYYLCGMAITVVYGILASLITGRTFIILSHYLNLSMFFVYATLWPDNRVMLFFFIPIKVKWLAYFEAAYYLVMMVLGRTLLPLVGFANCFLFCGSSMIAALKLFMMRTRGQARRNGFRTDHHGKAGGYPWHRRKHTKN